MLHQSMKTIIKNDIYSKILHRSISIEYYNYLITLPIIITTQKYRMKFKISS